MKSLKVIQREVKQYKQQTNSFNIFKPKNISAASFQVFHTIALHGKPLSDGAYIREAFKTCSEMLFEDFSNKTGILKKVDELPLARNTVKDRIIAMNQDVTDQLLIDLRNAEMFSICLDESTDVTSSSWLAVIRRFRAGNIMKEELIKLMTLSEKTRGQDVIAELKKEFAQLGMDMQNIVSVTTDGAPSIIGKHVGLVQLPKQHLKRSFVEFHCIIHQEAPCAKSLKIASKSCNCCI